MKLEIKDRWIAALRSGEYTQGYGCLHRENDNTYCALGVLCDLASQDNIGGWTQKSEHDPCCDFNAETRDSMGLPLGVQKWAGIDSCDPYVGSVRVSLLNDDEWETFDVIAKYIEEYL